MKFYQLTIIATAMMMISILTPYSNAGIKEDTSWISGDPQMMEIVSSDTFIENLGQWDESISFVGNTNYGKIGLGERSIFHLILTEDPFFNGDEFESREKIFGHILKMDMVGTNEVTPSGLDKGSYPTNYFIGNDPEKWVTNAMSYGSVEYDDIWDGIDLNYILSSKGPKYTFTVSPEGNIDEIKFRPIGQKEMRIGTGSIEFNMDQDLTFLDSGLLVYYEDNGEVIPARFKDLGDGSFGFELKDRDVSRSVIIDPIVRSTLLGGASSDTISAIETGENGDYYIGGRTYSTDFPTTPGTIKQGYSGQYGDIFITKMNRSLGSLDYSSIFGGSDADVFGGLRIVNGEAIISGYTQSSDFQTTTGCYQNETEGGWRDGFITRMNRTGTGLIFSTYISGSEDDFGNGIEIDDDGNIIYFGYTNSTDFPVTADAYSGSISSTYDGFVLKILPNGTDLVYSSFMGGNAFDSINGALMDPSGDIFLYGSSSSSDLTFHTGAYDSTMSGPNDCWIIRMDSNLSTISNATLFGSGGFEGLNEIEMNSDGDLILNSYGSGFPVTSGAYDQTQNGGNDVVIAKMDPTLSTLHFCTYLGGAGDERFAKLELDSNDNIFIAGYTQSTNFPTTPGAYDESYNGTSNVNSFVTKMNGDGSYLLYSTFLGGSGSEFNYNVKSISDYNVVLVGTTNSPDFPLTPGAFDTTPPSGIPADGYITELSLLSAPAKPMNLTGVKGYDWFDLSWEMPGDDGGRPILDYEIYMMKLGESLKTIASVDNETFDYNVTGLIPDGNYIFYVKARNIIGSSMFSNIVRFSDTIRPEIEMDLTTSDNTPLGKTTLRVRAMDNTFIDSVWVEYWIGDGPVHMNASMDLESPGIFSIEIDHPDEVFTLEYIFRLNDTSDNWVEDEKRSIEVFGEVRPSILEDRTPQTVRAGERLRFLVVAEDNDEVKNVHLEFWTNIHQKQNVTMNNLGDGQYDLVYPTKRYSLMPLTYSVHVSDVSGHWNGTMERTVSILDVDAPVLSYDKTPSEAMAGHPLMFDISVNDNQRILDAWVLYSIDNGEIQNGSLEKTQGSTYQLEIDIPQTLGRISYSFHAMDENNNTGWYPITEIPIIDVDAPEVVNDLTTSSLNTGDDISFSFEISDNIAVGSAYVEYWFNEEEHRILDLDEGSLWTGELQISMSSLGAVSYFMRTADTSGNWMESEVTLLELTDVLFPRILQDLTPFSIGSGSNLDFGVLVSDNIGIRKVRVNFGSSGALEESMEMEKVGSIYSKSFKVPADDDTPLAYRFSIIDIHGNTFVTDEKVVLIEDIDPPEITPVDDLKVTTITEINLVVEASDNIELSSLMISGSPIIPVENRIKGVIEEPGIYTIKVTATDASGNIAEMSFIIEVASVEKSEKDEGNDTPLWMIILPILAILVLLGAIIFLAIGNMRERYPDLPIPVENNTPAKSGENMGSGPNQNIEGIDELDRLFNS